MYEKLVQLLRKASTIHLAVRTVFVARRARQWADVEMNLHTNHDILHR
jgi:hypothetical protein